MPDIIDLLDKLKKLAIFKDMGIRDLKAIASIAEQKYYRAGEVLQREGEASNFLYLVLEGRIGIYEAHGSSEERLVVETHNVSFMGWVCLFAQSAPPHTWVAIEPLKVMVINRYHFEEIMRIYPQIGINLSRFFARRIHHMISQSKESEALWDEGYVLESAEA